MKKLILAICFFASAAIALATPLEINLQALKIERDAAGAETLVSADVAGPGDVIEYRAVYTNTSSGDLKSVVPELPIPVGLAAIEGTDLPKATHGSLDGSTFAPLPLLDAEGNPVAVARIRAFRWSVDSLAPAESVTVRIRAAVNR